MWTDLFYDGQPNCVCEFVDKGLVGSCWLIPSIVCGCVHTHVDQTGLQNCFEAPEASIMRSKIGYHIEG